MGRIVITGATGTIGRSLVAALRGRGDQIVALSRQRERAQSVLGPGVEAQVWSDPTGTAPPAEAIIGATGVVHLLGEPVAQRWSTEAKTRIRESRIASTRLLVASIRELPDEQRPAVLVSQSAVGFYGSAGDREVDEQASPGSDFLAGVVVEWEREARQAEGLMRVVRTRTGVVLTPTGGALGKMLPFFRLGIGGPVAGGGQYVPWIHVEDVVNGLLFCIDQHSASGAVNLTAPTPVTNATFSRALGRALRRPAVLPVPGFALNLLYGEMAEIVTTGQRAIPRRLLELGFQFGHKDLVEALRDVLARSEDQPLADHPNG